MKRNTFIVIIISLSFFFILSSCSGDLVSRNNLKLKKGTDVSEFQAENIKYDGNFVLTKLNAKTKDNYVVFVSRVSVKLENELYFYAFKNDKLIYWGEPNIFSRSGNEILIDIAEETLDYAKSLYK